jgi:hypothetical protein
MSNIPPDVAEIFEPLRTEIIWLHVRWILYEQLYEQLFGHSEKRVDLLNESAGTLFYVVQDTLLGEIKIALSKLTDPARQGKFDNLSLEMLQSRIKLAADQQLQDTTRSLLDSLHSICGRFRTWRNKTLAHLDLDTALKAETSQLPAITRQMVNDALRLVRDYMNEIEGRYDDSETAYEHFIMHASDGNSLAHLLKAGLRYDQLCRDGDISWDDFPKSEWYDA